jgi:lipid-binding SYLF domain-containing protein
LRWESAAATEKAFWFAGPARALREPGEHQQCIASKVRVSDSNSGGQATDFLLLVMNPKGADSLLKSKVKLGADAAVAAGPKGRTAMAATDAFMRAEILTYSRSRGLFAGVSLEGSTLRQDNGANEKLYGHKITAREIVSGGRAGGHKVVAILQKASPRNESDPASIKK